MNTSTKAPISLATMRTNLAEKVGKLKRVINFDSSMTSDAIGLAVQSNLKAAFLAICCVAACKTAAELSANQKGSGGTHASNQFGFSKKHVTEGCALAKKFEECTQSEEAWTRAEAELTMDLAFKYRVQLQLLCLDAQPFSNGAETTPAPKEVKAPAKKGPKKLSFSELAEKFNKNPTSTTKKAGRPAGSKNKAQEPVTGEKRGPGRPRGSKNVTTETAAQSTEVSSPQAA